MQNQKSVLIPAGRWQIVDFTYRPSHCMCCGRPIWYVLHMKNLDHDDKIKVDPSYTHLETIQIGRVCGPDVFKKSTVGFYEDPNMEWCRQYRVFKEYIDYIVLCVKNQDVWSALPSDLSGPVDAFLEEGYKKHAHSGPWWVVRDAKRAFLRTRRNGLKLPDPRVMQYTGRRLLTIAKQVALVPTSWELLETMELNKHDPKVTEIDH